jgi:hypothetical protein
MDIPENHEITSIGQRTAYVPSELPTAFDDDASPADFGDYENLRNCVSGLAYIFDQHVIAIRAVDADPSWQEYSPPYRNKRIQEAREKVTAETVKQVARLEKIAESAEREATEIGDSLSDTADKIDAAQANVCVTAFQSLSREKRVETVHRLATILAADSGADGRTRAAAREYLGALLNTNPFAGLLDQTSRQFLTVTLAKAKDPAAYARSRHLALAGRAIRENAARVRNLINGR